MSHAAPTRKTGFIISLLAVIGMLLTPVAQAAMVSTDELIQTQKSERDRDRLARLLAREDVQQQLIERGVDPQAALARVARLSDAEVARINQRIGELPAGGADVLGVALVVFIVLVITDVIGATNIFPFIKPVKMGGN